MKKTLILSLIISLGLFSACNTESQVEKTNDQSQLDSQEISNMVEGNLTTLEYQYIADAIDTLDINKCELLEGQDKVKNCLVAVENAKVTLEAVSKLDIEACSVIDEEDYKKYCKDSVALKETEIGEQLKKNEEELAKIEKNEELYNEAIENMDLEKCNDLEIEVSKNDCQFNVIVPQVIESNDTSLCEQITDLDTQENCKSLL